MRSCRRLLVRKEQRKRSKRSMRLVLPCARSHLLLYFVTIELYLKLAIVSEIFTFKLFTLSQFPIASNSYRHGDIDKCLPLLIHNCNTLSLMLRILISSTSITFSTSIMYLELRSISEVISLFTISTISFMLLFSEREGV